MKIGFIGAGRMAGSMARTVHRMTENGEDGYELYAVTSYEYSEAEAFAKEYGFQKTYQTYEELLSDDAVDLVYIVLPVNFHCEWTIKALNHGRHVLVEKPCAMNLAEAEQMVEAAKRNKKLLAEGMWTRYMPSREMINSMIGSGIIGPVHSVSANLGYPCSFKARLLDPKMGGGALYELSVYALNFITMILGSDIKTVHASCIRTETGVDGQNNIMLEYSDGKMGTTYSTIFALTSRAGVIAGEKGFIEVENVNNPQTITAYERDWHHRRVLKTETVPEQLTGYEYELRACKEAVESGAVKCPDSTYEDVLASMKLLDQIQEAMK